MHCYQLEIKQLARLAVPVLLASVAQTAMGFVDTIMAGGVSATDMAAVSVAASLWLPAILFGVGLLMALIPIVAQCNGAGQRDKIPFEIQHGLWMALIISVPIMIFLFYSGGLIEWMNIDPTLTDKTVGYLHAVVFAVPAYLLFQCLKNFADGLSLTVPGMVIGFIGLAFNVPLNWIFVYGKFGLPAMGGVGCGVATAIVYWLMFIALTIFILKNRKLSAVGLFKIWYKPQMRALWRLVKLGFPVATAMFFEVSLFAVIALIISPLGSTIVAAHQVAMNFSSLIFMIPMSIGAAVSIRVSHQLGEENVIGAKIATRCGLTLSLLIAILTATLTVLGKVYIVTWYTSDLQVITIAGQLLILAAIYQCTDSLQVVAAGALRGYKDMTAIFFITFIAYWLCGLPVGYVLGMTNWIVPAMGPHGFWIGLIVGLTVAAVLLCGRLYWLQKQDSSVQIASSLK